LYRTLIGLALAALTLLVFYLLGRNRYKCPHCGRVVKWSDVTCPHCGNDMEFRHRVGPPPSKMVKPIITVHSAPSATPSRGRRGRNAAKR
jgi:predicted amidophosphoribosyltransferase